jgi:hypothetical protein
MNAPPDRMLWLVASQVRVLAEMAELDPMRALTLLGALDDSLSALLRQPPRELAPPFEARH